MGWHGVPAATAGKLRLAMGEFDRGVQARHDADGHMVSIATFFADPAIHLSPVGRMRSYVIPLPYLQACRQRTRMPLPDVLYVSWWFGFET